MTFQVFGVQTGIENQTKSDQKIDHFSTTNLDGIWHALGTPKSTKIEEKSKQKINVISNAFFNRLWLASVRSGKAKTLFFQWKSNDFGFLPFPLSARNEPKKAPKMVLKTSQKRDQKWVRKRPQNKTWKCQILAPKKHPKSVKNRSENEMIFGTSFSAQKGAQTQTVDGRGAACQGKERIG